MYYVYCIASLDAVGEYWKRNYLCSVNHKNACILADAEATTKRNNYFKKKTVCMGLKLLRANNALRFILWHREAW